MIRDALGDMYERDGRGGAMVTSVHPLQAGKVARIAKKYTPVIVGGPGALSPGAYESAAAVVLGDYRAFFAELSKRGYDAATNLSNVFVHSESRGVSIDSSFDWSASGRYRAEDGKVQVFCSRGCKRRCAFCQTGWALNYSENPDVDSVILQAAGAKVTLVSNALSQVSYFDRLPASAASHTLREAVSLGVSSATVRVGIEGVSQRLRKAVQKPISNQELVDGTLLLNRRGCQVRWFLIAGLPGEVWEDWLELTDCVKAYTTNHARGTLQISFTAYVPEPSTPLKGQPYSEEYFEHYERFARWYFDYARINHLSIFRPQGPKPRAAKAAAQMHPSNDRVLYPHRGKIVRALGLYQDSLR